MKNHKFSKREAIVFGWQVMKQNLRFLIPLLLLSWVLLIAPNIAGSLLEGRRLLFSFIRLLDIILTLIMSLGLTRIYLNFHDNVKSKITDLFSQYRLFFSYLFAFALYIIIGIAGFILLVIPGVYASIRLGFFHYFIVDKKTGPIESLKKSWQVTRGSVWDLFLFYLVILGINILGVLCLGIGLFASIPISGIAMAFVYRKLLGEPEREIDKRTGYGLQEKPMEKYDKILFGCIIAIIFIGIAAFFNAARDIPPPETSDLIPEWHVISAEENAYTYLNKAIESSNRAKDERDIIFDYFRGKTVEKDMIAGILKRNAESLEFISRGLLCAALIVPEVTYDTLTPYLPEWRHFAWLMEAKARYEREDGDYAKATGTCIDLLSFGNMVQEKPGTLIQYLVGIAVLEIGFREVRELAKDPNTPDEELVKIMGKLSALGSPDSGLVHAMKMEYIILSNTIDDFVDGNLPALADFHDIIERLPWYLFQCNRTKLLFAETYREIIEKSSLCYAGMKLDEAGMLRELSDMIAWENPLIYVQPNLFGKTFFYMSAPSHRVLAQKCHAEASIEAMRVIIALNRYLREEDSLPDDLQALVPKYIPEVPVDPFDCKPFRYSKSEGIVYSVGEDLIDSGGSLEDIVFEVR